MGDGGTAQLMVNELADKFEAFPGTDDYDTALDILGAYADQDQDALNQCKKGDRVGQLDPNVVRIFAYMNVSDASIDGSFSTKQVLDLANDEPDTPQSHAGGELDLGGFTPTAAPAGKKPDSDDDLC